MSTPTPIYQKLLAAIENGDLRPGDRLLETDLAQRFGVSRTPIREAIRRLEADGLVAHKPRVGAMIRVLAQQEIVELYEMRIVLEATAAQMAAKHASKAEIHTLKTLNAQMMQVATDPIKWPCLIVNFMAVSSARRATVFCRKPTIRYRMRWFCWEKQLWKALSVSKTWFRSMMPLSRP